MFGIKNGLSEQFRTLSLDDFHIENDNCCFCYYDAVVKQLPDSGTTIFKSTEYLGNSTESHRNKKNHIKFVHANFSSDVNSLFIDQ